MAKHWCPKAGYEERGEWIRQAPSVTLQSLRSPAKYWIVSDAQLKRDLKPRTLRDVYRENRALRGVERSYVPRWEGQVCFPASGYMGRVTAGPGSDAGLFGPRQMTIREEYLAWCHARNHMPHPASIDSDHPQNCHRETMPKRQAVDVSYAGPYGLGMAIPEIHSEA